ncbi:hypothetical protein D3C72_2192130 [compost metagenome]
MVPSSARKAIDSGSSVLRIQKQCPAFCSNTNSMPPLGAMLLRYISPCSRAAGVAATSAWIAYMPALSGTTGSAACAWAWPAASMASAAAVRMQRDNGVLGRKDMVFGLEGCGWQPQA